MATLGRSPGAAPLTSADIPDGSVTAAKIATDTIVAGDVAPNAITASELADDAVDTNAIADDAVTADKLANSINTDIAAGVAALPKAGGTMTGNIVMGDDTSIGIGDAAERIEFDGAGDISVLGANLGVGTDAPANILTVEGGANDEGIELVDGSGNERIKMVRDTAGNAAFTMSDASNAIKAQIHTATISYFTGGNVGIGTTTTGYKLDVRGPVSFDKSGTSDALEFQLKGGEGRSPYLLLQDDEGDDNADLWLINNTSSLSQQDANIYYTDYDSGSWDNEFVFINTGEFRAEGGLSHTGVDYAEYFEWKTELADEATAKSLYGMTVVLDGDKVRLAQAGEELNILGVVRPPNVSGTVGGGEHFKWKNKYLKDVWGQVIKEEYTQCKWYEYDADGNETKKHLYMKDRIPEYVVKDFDDLDNSEPNWHLLESNFILDGDGEKIPLVVPSTSAQKTAANYKEWSVYKEGKKSEGRDIGGTPLLRKKVNPDYDSTNTYNSRAYRSTEWVIIGLLGQVQILDTAIIPAHWIKMKNLESGIDLYFIK